MTGGLLDLLEKPTSNPRPLSFRVDPKLVNDEFITPAACYNNADDLGFIETDINISATYRRFKPWVGSSCPSTVQFLTVGRKSGQDEAIDRLMLGR